MKKTVILLCFAFIITKTFPQSKLVGSYHDAFASKIILNKDSTFRYDWFFDISSSWSYGKWSVINDTLFLKIIPIFDTVRYTNKSGLHIDSIILSNSTIPYLYTQDSVFLHPEYTAGFGQNKQPCPSKLFYKKARLYQIGRNGKLIKLKSTGYWTHKKFPTYYVRNIEK